MSKTEFETMVETLKNQQEAMVLTAGVSMRPMLREHLDVAVIGRVERPLERGDVALYCRREDMPLILHRVLKVTADGLVLRGDNTYCREYVKKEAVVGILKAFYRNGRYHDCETDRGYRVYIWLNRVSYPIRWLWKAFFVPKFRGIKRRLIKRQ